MDKPRFSTSVIASVLIQFGNCLLNQEWIQTHRTDMRTDDNEFIDQSIMNTRLNRIMYLTDRCLPQSKGISNRKTIGKGVATAKCELREYTIPTYFIFVHFQAGSNVYWKMYISQGVI